jgi:chemotaxis protein CheC
MSFDHDYTPSGGTLAQILRAATSHAGKAMSQWTGNHVRLEVDDVRETPLEDALQQFGNAMDPLVMVSLDVIGDYGGRLVLSFDDEDGRRLAATILGRSTNSTDDWTSLEESAVMETANIFASAFLSELALVISTRLTPSAPWLTRDFGASVLEQALLCQALDRDTILCCRTRFTLRDEAVNWSVAFVPDQRMIAALQPTLA